MLAKLRILEKKMGLVLTLVRDVTYSLHMMSHNSVISVQGFRLGRH